MDEREGIVAVGLLTERDLAVLGQGFRRAYRVQEGHDFDELLAAIDRAERQYHDRCAERAVAQDCAVDRIV